MTTIRKFIPLIALVAAGCNVSDKDNHEITTIDIAGNIDSPDVDNIEIADLKYTPLDNSTDALLARRAQITGIAGDTVFVCDFYEADRVVMFSMTDGRMLGSFDHTGQGPGEYNWIEMAAVDAPNREIIIKSSGGDAFRYTMSDSLVKICSVRPVKNLRLACGSVEEGFNIGEKSGDDWVIRQFDKDFGYVDSIVISDYDPGYRAGNIWSSSRSTYYLDSRSDTLWRVARGVLEPTVVVDRGGKVITPEIESGELKSDYNAAGKYIAMNATTVGDDYLYSVVTYGDKNRSDVYRLSDGALAYRRVTSGGGEVPGIELTYGGAKLHAFMFYYADGRWYALIDDSEAVDADGRQNDDGELNRGLVSFTIR